jgi:REP element-mobilizing transposase RayT
MSIEQRLFHIVINTHSTWLHGDRRGFRSREHRIHSSGDYRNPPPRGEHASLHAYQLEHSAPPTFLPSDAFALIGNAIVENLTSRGHVVQAASVNPTHSHQLVSLPNDFDQIKVIIGWSKRFATRAARQQFEVLRDTEIWAEGETIKPINDESHRSNARDYILTKQGADAWTWTHENGASW